MIIFNVKTTSRELGADLGEPRKWCQSYLNAPGGSTWVDFGNLIKRTLLQLKKGNVPQMHHRVSRFASLSSASLSARFSDSILILRLSRLCSTWWGEEPKEDGVLLTASCCRGDRLAPSWNVAPCCSVAPTCNVAPSTVPWSHCWSRASNLYIIAKKTPQIYFRNYFKFSF